MVSARHGKQTVSQGIHGIVAYEYADSSARLAANGFTADDLYKIAIQLDNKSLWILTSISPITWQSAQSNISGNSPGDIIYYNGTNWVNLPLGNDGYVLAANSALTQPNWVPPSGGTATATFDFGIAAGSQTGTSGTIVLSNSNGITFGMAGNKTITASYTVPSTAGLISNINLSAGTTSNNLSALTFSNSNGLAFGLNGSVITGSYTVPSTAGLISAINVSGGTTSNNLSALTFSNSNNVSFGLNGSTLTASASFPAQTNQTIGLYGLGNTTQNSSTTLDARSLSFNGLGNITVGYSNGSIQFSGSQTVQTQNVVVPSAGTQTATSGTLVFSNSNGISFGMSGSSRITASYTVPSTAGLISNINVSAGTTSNNLSAFTFSNANNVTFGLDASTITASASFNQTNQSLGLYGLGNTTQNSSTTLDARSLSFNGLGNITVGYSNGSIQLSGLQTAQTQNVVVPSAGTQTATSGTLIFSNSNGISFGMSGSSRITASYTVPSTAGLISNINVSAGTTSNNLSALTFADSNGITFGLDGSIITASIQPVAVSGIGAIQAGTQTATSGSVAFANSNGITFGMSGSSQITASYTVPSTAGLISNINFSAGTTSNNLSALTFSNSNGISFGLNGSTVTASYTVPSTAGLVSAINISAGTTSNNLSAFIASNSNNVSFGLNGSTLTASASFPAQTNQTVGLYAIGNTTQNSSTTLDARTLSFNGLGNISIGYSNGSIQVSGSQTVQTQSNVQGISAGTQVGRTGDIIFANSNGITFGMSGSSQVTASYTVPSTAGLISAINVSAGTTSNNLSALTFSNSNGLAFGLNGSTITGSYTVPTQTNQTVGLYALGNTTQNSSTTLDARNLSFNGLGIITAGYSNGSIQLSATQSVQTQSNVQGISAGTQVGRTGDIVFSNSNGITFGMSGSNTITASYTVPTQTNQTIGLYALGNTTQNSSTTLDARTLSFNGLGGNTVGYSDGSIQISGVTTNNLISAINISAGTTSNNLSAFTFSNSNGITFGLNGSVITASIQPGAAAGIGGVAAGTQTQTSGTLIFSNSNGVTFGMSNSSVITASVNAGGGGTRSYYAVGNTTQNSSATLGDTISFNALGAMSMGYSNGSIQVSAPVVSSLVGSGGVSLSTNGNTISIIGYGPNRSYIEIMNGERMTTCGNFSETALSNRLMLLPFWLDGQGIQPKTVRFLVTGIASSNRSLGGTYKVGLYSAVNGTQLSLFGSDSMSYSITASSQSTAWNGFRAMDFTGMTGTMTNEGRWAVGLIIQNVSNNANWANVGFYGGDNIPAFSGYLVGNTTSNTNAQSQILPFWGCYTNTTTGFPNSIGLTDINGNNSASVRDVYCIIKQI